MAVTLIPMGEPEFPDPPIIIPEEFPRTHITLGEIIDYVAQEATKKVIKNLEQ